MKKLNNNIIIEAKCNQCGKQLEVKNGIIIEGAISIRGKWGYFSSKDLEQHSFELCEACYDNIVEQFAIPIERKEYIIGEEIIE